MPFKISVIDDVDLFREALAADLQSEGFGVFEAANGTDGLQLIRESDADIAIVDVFMPGMGGADLLELVQRARPRVGKRFQGLTLKAATSITDQLRFNR